MSNFQRGPTPKSRPQFIENFFGKTGKRTFFKIIKKFQVSTIYKENNGIQSFIKKKYAKSYSSQGMLFLYNAMLFVNF